MKAALAALLLSAAAFGDRPHIAVVKSSDLAAYAAVVAGFGSEAHAAIDEITLDESADAQAKAFKKIADAKPALVLAIGPAAANGARKALSDVPIVFCMVPYYEKYGLEGPNVTGIALTSDLSVELSTLKAIAPAAKRVGMLEDPRYSQKIVDDAAKVAGERGMSIVPLELDSASKVDKALKGGRSKVDALLMIADKTVGNAAVVKRLIAFAEEEKLPLVALSPSQVKEGALLSLSPSSVGIGQQARRIANRIVVEKVDPGAMAVAQPDALELSLNLSTSKRLGDLAEPILQLAAKQGYTVRVFE